MSLNLGEVFVEPGFEAVDNVDGIITARVEVKGDFNSSRPGKYELFYSVEDKAGNRSTTFKRTLLVSELDRTPPKLELLGSEVVTMTEDGIYNEPGYRAMDNKDGNLTAEVLAEGELNSSLPGTYELFYSVRDNAGNISDLLKRKIIVEEKDRMAPQIVLFGPATIMISLGDDYMEPGFYATDNQDGDLTSSVQIASDLNTSAVGQYELIYSVQDSTGNPSANIKRTIIVKEKIAEKDETPPMLILLGDINITLFLEEPFVEPGFNATDNKDGNISSSVVIQGSVDSMKVGKYELSYSVTDKAGNGSEILVRTITITERPKPVDNVPPRIELVGGEVLQIIAGSIFAEPGYTATDDVDGNITSKVKIQGAVDSMTPGKTGIDPWPLLRKCSSSQEDYTLRLVIHGRSSGVIPHCFSNLVDAVQAHRRAPVVLDVLTSADRPPASSHPTWLVPLLLLPGTHVCEDVPAIRSRLRREGCRVTALPFLGSWPRWWDLVLTDLTMERSDTPSVLVHHPMRPGIADRFLNVLSRRLLQPLVAFDQFPAFHRDHPQRVPYPLALAPNRMSEALQDSDSMDTLLERTRLRKGLIDLLVALP